MQRNLIIFLSDNSINQLYARRVEALLQPNAVHQNWYADTDDAFLEITRHSPGNWQLLVTDPTRLEISAPAINSFRAVNLACRIAAFVGPGEQLLTDIPVTMISSPGDIDQWLSAMHFLLND
jgi:hypothetical protein